MDRIFFYYDKPYKAAGPQDELIEIRLPARRILIDFYPALAAYAKGDIDLGVSKALIARHREELCDCLCFILRRHA